MRKRTQRKKPLLIHYTKHEVLDLRNNYFSDLGQDTLLSQIGLSISNLNPRDGYLVESFLGIQNDEARSLAAIARELQISRERARQILDRSRKSILKNSTWTFVLQEKLARLLRNRTIPLRVYMLELEDDWFEGTAQKPKFLKKVLHKFLKSEIRIIKLNKVWTISKVSDDGFCKSLKSILHQFECAADEKYTESETKLLVKAFLHGRGQAYLIDDINEAMAPYLHFHLESDTNERKLVGVGSSIASMVQAALSSFDSPQHYTEVAKRYCELTKTNLCDSLVKQIHQNLVSSRFLLFGRGTYGTWDHFPLRNGDRIRVAGESERLLKEAEINRQWHSVEIMDLLQRKSHEKIRYLVQYLDKYSLSIILSNSESFVSLGRMLFKLDGGHIPDSRFDISNLAEKVLFDAGRPLPRFELINGIKKFRGMNSDTCVLTGPRVGRVAPGVWGLVDRDFILDEETRQNILNMLEEHLRQTMCPLDHCDIGLLLAQSEIAFPEDFNTYMLVGLAETDERFHLSRTSVSLAN